MEAGSKIKIRDFKRLFDRIGGEEQLGRILEDFYQRMAKDILIGFFFTGKDLKQIATTQQTFLMKAWGITASYSGKAPADAHRTLPPILKGHFDRRLRILEDTLKDYHLRPEEIQAWVGFENAFREGIVSS